MLAGTASSWRPRCRSTARRADRRRHVDLPDDRGLAGVLALHLRHDRHAQGRDAPARRDPGRLRDLRRAGARHPPRRPVPVGGQGVLRLRAGQLGAVPARRSARPRSSSRRRRGPDVVAERARRSTARRCSSPARRSSPTCCAPSCPPTRWPACGWPPRPARRCRPRCTARWTGALRRRHHRRHRHDRDAAHLPVQPARRGPAGHHRRRRARLRPAPARRATAARSSRARPGTLLRARRLDGHRVLVALRRVAAGVPGRVAAHRRHLRPGRGRLLRLPRPHRRHAQGQRHLGLARPRSRPGCSPTTPSPRPSSSPPSTPTGWRSRSPTCSCTRARRRPRTS